MSQLNAFRTAGRKIVAYVTMSHLSLQRLSLSLSRIGRNFADHAKELNNAVPTEPFFFLKPTTSYVESGGTIEIPQGVVAHHEGSYGLLH